MTVAEAGIMLLPSVPVANPRGSLPDADFRTSIPTFEGVAPEPLADPGDGLVIGCAGCRSSSPAALLRERRGGSSCAEPPGMHLPGAGPELSTGIADLPLRRARQPDFPLFDGPQRHILEIGGNALPAELSGQGSIEEIRDRLNGYKTDVNRRTFRQAARFTQASGGQDQTSPNTIAANRPNDARNTR